MISSNRGFARRADMILSFPGHRQSDGGGEQVEDGGGDEHELGEFTVARGVLRHPNANVDGLEERRQRRESLADEPGGFGRERKGCENWGGGR